MSTALESFAPHRPRLLRIAYRMLGTMSDAEDLVQDAYLRWHESDREAVRTVEAVLVTTVVRLAIDRQRRLKTERASYYGSWLPEPWLGDGSALPASQTDDLSYASMVLLERLTADERAAFLLREVFDHDYGEVAELLNKTESACRKLVQRAREQLEQTDVAKGRYEPSREQQLQLMSQLRAASRAQDPTQLRALLSDAVQLVSDGGGKVFAARYVLEGAAKVAKILWRFLDKAGSAVDERLVDLHGEPALASYREGALYRLTYAAARDGQLTHVYMLLNPDKLQRAARYLAP